MQSCKRNYKVLCTVVDKLSFTDIAGWISTKDLEHPFVILDFFPPFSKYLCQVIQYDCREDDNAGKDCTALRV